MPATAKTIRLVAAMLALAAGVLLITAKVHFAAEFTRQTAASDVVVMPAVQITAERPAPLVVTANPPTVQ